MDYELPLVDTSDAPLVDTSDAPSVAPLVDTSDAPLIAPLVDTSDAPSDAPLVAPSDAPSAAPSDAPSAAPLVDTSDAPLVDTSDAPSVAPLVDTSDAPSVEMPTERAPGLSEEPTPEEIKSKIPAEDMEGLQDLHNLTLSIGIPITKKNLHYLIDISQLEKAEKISAAAFVAALSPITEVGCMKIEHKSVTDTAVKTNYMLFDECAKDYELGKELDKIKNDIAADRWPEVLHHASMLVFYCRIVYSKLVRENLGQIQKWFRRDASDKCEDIIILKVDPTNTTLYCDLLVDYPKRVGIRICAENDY